MLKRTTTAPFVFLALAACGLPTLAACGLSKRAVPAGFMRIGARHGRLLPGAAADAVALDEGIVARETWIGGRSVATA